MKSVGPVGAAALGLLLTGCESRSANVPTAPMLVPSPSTPTVRREIWDLTTTVTSVTGPHVECSAPTRGYADPGIEVRRGLSINRSGESITMFVPDPWFDGDRYAGVIAGDDFTATSSFSGHHICHGPVPTRTDFDWEGRVSGRFTLPGYSLVATEVWSYRFKTGEEVIVRINWTAVRVEP